MSGADSVFKNTGSTVIDRESEDGGATIPLCPVKNCGIDVDIILESSDGQRLGAHKANLQQFSDAFPYADGVTTNLLADCPVLSEDGEVLRLMLQFMHHAPQPDLSRISFKRMILLANAVEKYLIYSAMGVCKVYMELGIDKDPSNVLAYACKNNYMALANKAAPLTVGLPISQILQTLSQGYALKWFIYRDHYSEKFYALITRTPPHATLHKGGMKDCDLWKLFLASVQGRLTSIGIGTFISQFDSIIQDEMESIMDCDHCVRRAHKWIADFTNDCQRNPIPEFIVT